MTSQTPDRRKPDLADESVGAAISSIPGLGFLGPLASRSSRAVRDEWARNLSVALTAAEQESGLTREQLTALVTEDPRFVPLYVRVLYAAGMNGHDEALLGMGAALGDAARLPSRLSEAEWILSAFVDLTADHIALLRCVAVPDPNAQNEAATDWPTDHVIDSLDLPETVVRIGLPALAARGLVNNPYGRFGGGEWYRASPLGELALDVIDRVRRNSRSKAITGA